MPDAAPETEIDTSTPDPARMYDWYLGGKTHYLVDEEAGRRVVAIWPGIRTAARANRDFVIRSTRFLAREAGIRQFLDIGTGIPTPPNLHEVAQAEAPDCRVVYTDNRIIVLRYAQALLRSSPEGRTAYVHADVTDPDSVLNAPDLRETLDLSRPVALCLNALLHYVTDKQGPYEIVSRLVEALPSGSYVTLTHLTADLDPATFEQLRGLRDSWRGPDGQWRSREEIERFFEGLEIVDPGLVVPHRWRPDPAKPAPPEFTDASVSMYAGVARVP
ncbi:SAM-dependent methyltransferase [Streptomyces sp. 6N223]|uniref:SAM-dependent methyltransferase n=1 Tax=Streptomyces sp. 6N223 TaxID=3457412 RepID=UPI003FD28E8D